MRFTRLPARVGLVTAAALTASLVVGSPASAASADDPMIFGATAHSKSEILGHEKVLGHKLTGNRIFKKWDSKLFGPDQIWARDTGHLPFVSVRSERSNGTEVKWGAIASAKPGSALYNDMVDHARELKSYGGKAYYIFNAEPEAVESHNMGTPAQFAAAWRKIHAVHKSVGVTNVEYVWTMTAWGFKRTDKYAAKNYYPGDAYVDHIAADAYNWFNCRNKQGTWQSMAHILDGQRKFGTLHPSKGLMVMEWGVVEDPNKPGRKAQWIRDMTAMFQKPEWSQYKAAMQWGGRSNVGKRSYTCNFDYLTSTSSKDAWKAMGNHAAFRGTGEGGPGDAGADPIVKSDGAISHLGSAASPNGNARAFELKVPSDVKAGDAMVMFLTINSTRATVGAPSGSGWTQLKTAEGNTVQSVAWRKVATGSDAGKTVSVPLSKYAMGQLVLHAYDGTDTANPVQNFAARVGTGTATKHVTPTVKVDDGGGWLLSYWADKSANNNAWSAPATQEVRNRSIGTGVGKISALSADSGDAVPAGNAGGLSATSGAGTTAISWSVVLAPGS